MRRFFRVFIPLAGIVLGVQMLGALLFRLSEGLFIQYVVPITFSFITLAVPTVFLEKFVGKRQNENGVSLPIALCALLTSIIIFKTPGPLWYSLILASILLIALATLWAFYEQKTIEKTKQEKKAVFKDTTEKCLHSLKLSYYKQFIVITNISVDDILFEMDDDCLLYQLSDGRYMVVLKQSCDVDEFLYVLGQFRNEAEKDTDVLGYIDNIGKGVCTMYITDMTGEYKSFVKGDNSFVPFDYSLLEKARLVAPNSISE